MLKLNYKENVNLAVGAGGRAMQQLLQQLIFKEFANPYLNQQSDQAILPQINGKLAFATDSYVVSPYFFNGGNIGTLAVSGTINDLAVSGATPLYISVSLILEEGLPLNDLRQIVQSMAKEARATNVMVVTGDTKVVEKGKGDGIFINTSGIGVIKDHVIISPKFAIGDKIIINGSIADHGMSIMACRSGFDFSSDIKSDCASLHELIAEVLAIKPVIRCMRDPTRGGVSAVLNEWSNFYNLGVNIDENKLLVRENVRGLCELLGLDPLHIANEGKVLIVSDSASATQIVAKMRQHPLGHNAEIIGEIQSVTDKFVTLKTTFGGMRRIEWLNGEQLPRIC